MNTSHIRWDLDDGGEDSNAIKGIEVNGYYRKQLFKIQKDDDLYCYQPFPSVTYIQDLPRFLISKA